MLKFLKAYFSFSRKERNGLFVLSSIILILIILNQIISLFDTEEQFDFSEFESEISEFDDQITFVSDIEPNQSDQYNFEPYYFDPNEVSDDQWRKMGLPEKTISTINNYKNKGGHFYSEEDIIKIYGFPNELYLKIKDFVKIEQEQHTYNNNYNSYYNNKTDSAKNQYDKYDDDITLDINSSSREEMLKIRGLPYYIVDRIIKYRELLGGFYKKEQILEVYGVDDKIYRKVADRIRISSDSIQKIRISEAEFKELLKHPYLEYENVRMINNFRKDYPINSMKDLLKNNLISNEQAEKLESYIQFSSE